MSMSEADLVWNRAALEAGGETPGPGDSALASLLYIHGMICNGGIHHALGVSTDAEWQEAVEGFSYFGMTNASEFLDDLPSNPVLKQSTAESEQTANQIYREMIPSDSFITAHFKHTYTKQTEQFAPIS